MNYKTELIVITISLFFATIIACALVGLVSNLIQKRKKEKEYIKHLEKKCDMQERTIRFYKNKSEVDYRG